MKKGLIAYFIFFGLTLLVSLATMFVIDVVVFSDDFQLVRTLSTSIPISAGAALFVAIVFAKKDKDKK